MSRPVASAVILLAALSVSCARVSPGPYSRNFSLETQPPRLLTTGEETSVPIAVINTGTRAWDPARVHVSYHWLWLVPRELVSRSRWNVPFQNGIRTELGDRTAAVPSGARVSLQGRLLPPRVPGLYWLQWDMVEEGATWFAQVAPRQRRTLVLVRPSVAMLAAPLPMLAAIAGLVAVRRRHAVAGFTDVLWCVTALVVKPLMVVDDTLLEPTAVAYWLIGVAALLPPLLVFLFLPRRWRAPAMLAIGIAGSMLILADVVYYRFFGDVLSAPALLAARQTSRVWGTIRSVATFELVWMVADLPFAVWLTLGLWRLPAREPPLHARVLAAAPIVAGLTLVGAMLRAPQVLAATPLEQMFRDRSVAERLGPFGYHAYDIWNYARTTWLRPAATDEQVQDAVDWFRERTPLRAGPGAPGFGAAAQRNLIVVQVESLQDFVVDFQVTGQPVMPFLARWRTDSLRFTNVTDQTNEGRTSDAEFTTMTSLLPLDHGAVAFRYPGNHYAALPRMLVEHGYSSLSAVAFEPGFWNRGVMHPAYGFQSSLFEPAFEMTEQIGWGLNDRDFLRQMVARLERQPRPFIAWLITLSLHHPFDAFPDRHKELKLGALERTAFGNYLHAMHYLDRALEDFRTSLVRDGLLDDSVVVVVGDHDAGFPRDRTHAEEIGIPIDEVAWTVNDRVPLFVRVPGSQLQDLRGVRSTPAGQTDFAPTLLALLGIDPARLPYIGRNLLAPADPPVVRPYGGWLDSQHLFLTRAAQALCYDVGRGTLRSSTECGGTDRSARRARQVSRFVIGEDLQQSLRVRLQPR